MTGVHIDIFIAHHTSDSLEDIIKSINSIADRSDVEVKDVQMEVITEQHIMQQKSISDILFLVKYIKQVGVEGVGGRGDLGQHQDQIQTVLDGSEIRDLQNALAYMIQTSKIRGFDVVGLDRYEKLLNKFDKLEKQLPTAP